MKQTNILLAALLLLCGCSGKKAEEKKAPIRVSTEVIATSASENGQTFVGTVEEQEATAVSFTGMGVIKRMLVAEGQQVSKGQLLAVMDDTQARNMLSGAEAAMQQANDALSRYKILHDAGSLPEVTWVEIQSKVAQAKAQLEVARKNLADCRLVAPVSGIIGKKLLNAGETAMPSQAVVSILDVTTVKVKASIPEAEMNSIHTTTPSTIKVEAIGRSYQGGKIEKGIVADVMTHTYDVRIEVRNSDRKLLPGMVANVSFGGKQTAGDALTLPYTAVQKKADGSLFVWTVDNSNKAHRIPVTIGSTTGNRIAITSGIQAGERIVTEGYQKLSEESEVSF